MTKGVLRIRAFIRQFGFKSDDEDNDNCDDMRGGVEILMKYLKDDRKITTFES